MKTEAEYGGLRATLAGATVLALALAFMGGCGDDQLVDPPGGEEPQGDAGTQVPDGGNPMPDGGTGTDGGTSSPPDNEFAVARFNADGTPDTTFGTNGVARLDVAPSTTNVRENLYSMAVDSQDRLVLFGSKLGTGRTDADRVTLRLTPDGALDTSFGTDGQHVLNVANLADNARNGIVQPDGKIVASGYTSQPTGVGLQTANRVVLLRLGENGAVDNTFGSKGVVNSNPFQPADPINTEWGFAEAYGAVLQGDKYVTAGYGRPTATTQGVDLCSFRYTSTGQLDTTWGTNGIVTLDLVGDNERGRNLTALQDGRVLIVGSGTPTTQNIDALVMMLQENGQPDTTFAQGGYKLFSFDRPDEAFFGAATSRDGNWVAAAGHVAGGGQDDDALLYIAPTSGGGTEFVQPVPLSETGNDRFVSVTFDANGKVVASGFITESGDNRMVVARFNTDGTLDTSFGTGGMVTLNIVPAGTQEIARGVVIQSTGKIVVAGPVEKK